MKLAQVLKQEREKRYYSIHQFSKIINIPVATYHGWENGAAPLLNNNNYKILKKIKEHYQLSWEYLFEGVDSKLFLEKATLYIAEYLRNQHVHT